MNHRQILVNNISNVSRLLSYLAVAFFMSPFLVKHLGLTLYGVWAAVQSAVGYLNLMDLGVQSAVMKYVAEDEKKADSLNLSDIVVNGLAFYCLIAVVGFFIILAVVGFGVPLLEISTTDVRLVRTVLLILGIDMLLMFPGTVFKGILTGKHLFYVANSVEIMTTVLTAIAVYLAVVNGYGLVVMAGITLGGNILQYSVMFFLAYGFYRLFSLKQGRINKNTFLSLFKFGLKSFLVMISQRINLRSDALIVGYFLSAAWVPFYSIPAYLTSYSRNLLWSWTQSFMPIFSGLQAARNYPVMKSLYCQYSRYTCLLFLPVPIFLFVYGPIFLQVWMGAEFAEKGGGVLRILTAALLPAAIQPLSGRLLTGLAKQDIMIAANTVSAVIFLALGALLIGNYGITGLAAAFMIASIIPCYVVLKGSLSLIGASLNDFFVKTLLGPFSVAAITLLLFLYIKDLFVPGTYLELFLHVVAGMLFFGLLGYAVALTNMEKRYCRERLASLMTRLMARINGRPREARFPGINPVTDRKPQTK